MQGAREAVAVETRATLLNPTFIRERMKGGEGSAQMFGELFRNVFGWNATRSSILDPQLYDELYIVLVAIFKPEKRKKITTNINAMDTMLLGGLWHGASWNFMIWGGLNGIGMVFYKFWKNWSIYRFSSGPMPSIQW